MRERGWLCVYGDSVYITIKIVRIGFISGLAALSVHPELWVGFSD